MRRSMYANILLLFRSQGDGRHEGGFTLIELMIVVAVVGILAIALGFTYEGWMSRYKMEKTTKDIYSDLMTARVNAMTRQRIFFVDFPTATSYRIIEDSNDNGVANAGAGDNVLQPFPKTVEYTLEWNSGGSIPFKKDGTIDNPGTICIPVPDRDADNVPDTDPDYDCIVISQTRINMGKLTTPRLLQPPATIVGGACDTNNCAAR